MSSIDSYKYVVRVAGPVHHLASASVAEAFKKVGEISIVSKQFNSFTECVNVAQLLVGQLSKLFSDANGKQYVILSKKNPLYDKDGEPIIGETWNPLTLHKLYAAEAGPLKNESVLKYSVCAEIQADAQVVEMTKERLPPSAQ